jgi:hypothetical protein
MEKPLHDIGHYVEYEYRYFFTQHTQIRNLIYAVIFDFPYSS